MNRFDHFKKASSGIKPLLSIDEIVFLSLEELAKDPNRELWLFEGYTQTYTELYNLSDCRSVT